jgi:hypothetical protein
MVEPVEVSVRFEKTHLDQLKKQYGKKWQNKLRQLVAAHLHTG